MESGRPNIDALLKEEVNRTSGRMSANTTHVSHLAQAMSKTAATSASALTSKGSKPDPVKSDPVSTDLIADQIIAMGVTTATGARRLGTFQQRYWMNWEFYEPGMSQ
jgi:hypothetical protein